MKQTKAKIKVEQRNDCKKERSKNEKAITLIALIVTIIVLLILAAVSIATLTGENGILTRANESATKTELEGVQEQAELAKQGVLSGNLVTGKDTTREDVINAIVDEMGGTVEGNLITTEDGKYEIMVKEDNTIEVVEKGQGYIDAEYKEASPASDFEYTVDEENNTVTITKYIGTDTVVNIPETIGGKTVVELRMGSFSRCNLQSVKIPDTVQTIGMYTFRNNELTYLNIPQSVTRIDGGAFNNNKLNEEQAYIYSRTSTGEEDKTTIVSYGGNQTDVIIPKTVTNIDDSTFNAVSSIESVVIGDNVTNIGAGSFYGCQNLTKVIIGKNVTRLEMLAFSNCSNLVDVEFKGDVPNFNYGGSGTSTEVGEGSVTVTTSVLSGGTFTYNDNLRIKVPEGKLENYKTATVTLNGEEYYTSLETWFDPFPEPDESWLNVFYD